MLRTGFHFAITGSGGSGKTVLTSAMKKEFPGLGLADQVNDTTRSRRDDEETKSDYNHISEAEYDEKEKTGLYISKRDKRGQDKHGNPERQKYGLSKPTANKTIFIVDSGGIDYLRAFSKETGEEIITIFLEVSREVGYKRMVARDGEHIAKNRYDQYKDFQESKLKSDYTIDSNRPLEQVQEDLYQILQQEIMNHTYAYESL